MNTTEIVAEMKEILSKKVLTDKAYEAIEAAIPVLSQLVTMQEWHKSLLCPGCGEDYVDIIEGIDGPCVFCGHCDFDEDDIQIFWR